MSIPAEYVSTTQFIVAGEYDNEYPVGRRIEVNLGIDGVDYSHVTAASYNATNDETTVTLNDAILTSNLVSIKRGVGDKTSLGLHYHTDDDGDSGYIPASALSEAQVELWQSMPDPTSYDDGMVMQINYGDFIIGYLDHEDLTAIGTNTHTQIDTHITNGDTHMADIPKHIIGPHYKPPKLKYKDIDEFYLIAGIYYKAGPRISGQYQDISGMDEYWTVSVDDDISIDTSIIGAKSTGGTGSWYSVFMTSATTCVILPYIRVDYVFYDYQVGETVINPAEHDNGTTADNSFVNADDCFNNYRLVYLSRDADHGTIWTISDTIQYQTDEIIVTGDITDVLDDAEWMQMIPAASTPCLYLGTIRIDNSGNLVGWYMPDTFEVELSARTSVGGNLSTSATMTDVGIAIPPITEKAYGQLFLKASNANAELVRAYLYSGDSGENQVGGAQLHASPNASNDLIHVADFQHVMTAVAEIRNKFVMDVGAGAVAATDGDFYIRGWKE